MIVEAKNLEIRGVENALQKNQRKNIWLFVLKMKQVEHMNY